MGWGLRWGPGLLERARKKSASPQLACSERADWLVVRSEPRTGRGARTRQSLPEGEGLRVEWAVIEVDAGAGSAEAEGR